jgi:Mg2+-importing ATPase
MTVLCSDKTGTLTEGKVHVHAALGIDGQPSARAMQYAWLNAVHQTGFVNPIDRAIVEEGVPSPAAAARYRKLDELPYDFFRKRLSVLVEGDHVRLMVTKGALDKVLDVCAQAENPDGSIVELESVRPLIDRIARDLGDQGFRTLGVAFRLLGPSDLLSREAESALVFVGCVALSDRVKTDARASIDQLARMGIRLKVISGDNRRVAAHVCRELGLAGDVILTGTELRAMSDRALVQRINEIDVVAEVEPNQKERLVRALTTSGQVVGYLGDGINDASAMHAADVSVSVEGAVDVAKEVADLVLLERDLGILAEAVGEGRRTFANTLKYVFMATSANFGNMFSMAGASLLLPFLPMLPKQILLMNLLTDLPEMTIAGDRVDEAMTRRPERWNIDFIRRFMVWFGLLSSAFDFLTFGVLWQLNVTPGQFRTCWFVESIVSASLIVLVVRTRRPFFRSRPAGSLLAATLAVVAATLVLPLTPLARLFDFELPPPVYLPLVLLIVAGYVIAAELLKGAFYRHDR